MLIRMVVFLLFCVAPSYAAANHRMFKLVIRVAACEWCRMKSPTSFAIVGIVQARAHGVQDFSPPEMI